METEMEQEPGMFVSPSDENGLIVGGRYIPEEMLIKILTMVDYKTLVQFHLVCKAWRILIDSYVWRNKAKLILGRSLHLKNETSWIVSYFVCTEKIFNRNLIKNNSGRYAFENWTLTENSGWTVENPPAGTPPLEVPESFGAQHCFVASRYLCAKEQIIDLLQEGFTEYLLDNIQPPIYVSEWYSSRWDAVAKYSCTVELMNEKTEKDMNTLDTRNYTGLIVGNQGKWLKFEHKFENYGQGLRRIKFHHEGSDEQNVFDYYGPKMAGACVRERMPGNPLDAALIQAVASESDRDGAEETISNLIAQGANVNTKNEEGANPDCWDQQGSSLLSFAARIDADENSNCDTLRLLIKFRAHVNLVNSKKQNVLWDAVTTGVRETVSFLLRKGVDASVVDSDGKSVLYHLAEQKFGRNYLNRVEFRRFFIKCSRELMAHGAFLSEKDLESRNVLILENFLEFGEKVEADIFMMYWNDVNRNVENPLHVASSNPRVVVLQKLLDTGSFDVNAQDECGMRPIHVATRCGNTANLELLLQRGADPNVFTKWNGETPFMIAKNDGNRRHQLILRRYGARRPSKHEKALFLFNEGAAEWLPP
ncbi:hypothetical protein QAD02_012727 [Eretmocerus hayati]|uniref:Uncharacterized protein n=1 Tax=Eretmocerus hayati TaxID=131215 RepID=A0ACC2P0I1_9HYME|nr:hypothetical protein QAD02_012727 [Eretmocerus hayati]